MLASNVAWAIVALWLALYVVALALLVGPEDPPEHSPHTTTDGGTNEC